MSEGPSGAAGDDFSNEGVSITPDREKQSFPKIIDDFEDSDLNEYTLTQGDSTNFTFNNASKNGSKSLELISNSGDAVRPLSTSGLKKYPSRGNKIKFWIKTSSDTTDNTFAFFCGLSDENDTKAINNGYRFDVNGRSSDAEITVLQNENRTELTNTSLTLSNNTWVKMSIVWGNPTLKFIIEDGSTTTLETDDTTFDSGGIGYQYVRGSTSGSVLIDYVRITE